MWPYLLGHYALGSTDAERDARDGSARASYENTLSEWLAVEAIVRQRDKEASCLAKLSSESTTSEIPLIGAQPWPTVRGNGGCFSRHSHQTHR